MDENEKNSSNINGEELKNETANTVNEFKDTLKNVNIKADANETKGFLSSLWKSPLEKLDEIAHDESHKYLKYVVIILAIWMIIVGAKGLISTVSLTYIWKTPLRAIWSIVADCIYPLVSVVVLSGIIYFMNKKSKKSLTTVIACVTTAKIPVVISSIVGLLTLLSSGASKITSPFSGFCSVISIILVYFAAKLVCDEENHADFLKKYIAIMGIFYIVKFLLSFLGVSI